MSSRLPRLALAAWSLAAVLVAALVAAVWHFLAAAPDSRDMPAMHALTRAGATNPTRPLTSALLSAWQLDAVAVAVLVLAGAAYLTGVALVPLRSPGVVWPVRRTLAFFGGLAVGAFATNGSIAVYDQVLFTAHMAGHLALVMVAPALLMWGRPIGLALAASPEERRARWERRLRGPVVSVLSAPPVALASYAAVIVGSHLTGLMDTIMRNGWAGQVEHLVYVLVGCQFFALVVGDEPLRWRLASPTRWVLLAIAMAVDTFTGIVLMQGTHAIALLPSALHVDALSDTRTGGAIMWFGGDAIMALIMVGLVVGWLRTADFASAEQGWLEQARVTAFNAHTGSDDGAGPAAIDADDDAARAAYNQWLAKLDARGR
ncbi:MAG TPA: cytochrome c oxidase assembly protein [Jatrophihabitans sp.]|jgi:putative copper resistance protein D|uniref:cytochrome c oxidase assembly protein n=1 Tax=Jatrophihabitans sp. TaxID=1932789 RepID=UPI002E081F74|nr:cytochrome c oxidase assembly protein [Jatrophihabitans sp.]